MDFEAFSRTIDNRFVIDLFEFLLSGVIVLVILRAWRKRSDSALFANHWCLLLGGTLLSLSLAYSALWTGTRFFFQFEISEPPVSLASHICLTGAWLLIGLQFVPRTMLSPFRCRILGLGLMGLALCPILLPGPWTDAESLFEGVTRVLDGAALAILAATTYLIVRSTIPARRVLSASMCLFWLAGALHLGSRELVSFPIPAGELLFWNLEQLIFSTALLLLALAIGEMSATLFDTVFIRIQIAFILLASFILLVVTGTERSEYLLELRGRSQNLAAFAVARLEASFDGGQPFLSALEQEDLLTRIATDFGNLPELAAVQISAADQVAVFTINPDGKIRRSVSAVSRDGLLEEFSDQDRYFLIGSFPVGWAPPVGGMVELYGTKRYFNQYIQKRAVVIFTLFTAAVALATLMIGLVVYHAERTLGRQEEELKTKQEELLMASKLAMLGELAGSVAHEVNNPATTIMSRASFLLRKRRADPMSAEDREDLSTVVEQAQRIAHITSSLLGFSRKHVVEVSPISICEVIEKSIGLVQHDLSTGSVRVNVRGCPSPVRVLGDRHSLVQVFVNLLQNSMDAMSEGGHVQIEVSPCDSEQSSLQICFSDTGPGIAEGHLSRIFVPFFTTKRLGKGTGLGLSVVHGIITEHKGSIRVESQVGVCDIATRIAEEEHFPIETRLLDGKAFQKIVEFIRSDPPWLLLVGRLGIHSDEDMDIGGNTENLCRLANCNILVTETTCRPSAEYQVEATVTWTKEAEFKMDGVPARFRGMAMKAVQNYCLDEGHTVVTSSILNGAIRQLLPESMLERMGISLKGKDDQAVPEADPESGERFVEPGNWFWTDKAVGRLQRVPEGFMRNAAKTAVENYARENGVHEISVEVVEKGLVGAREQMVSAMRGEVSTPHQSANGAAARCPFHAGRRSFECTMCGYVVDSQRPDACASCGAETLRALSEEQRRALSETALSLLKWDQEASKKLERIPPGFMRTMTKCRIEQWARNHSQARVTLDVVQAKYNSWKTGSSGLHKELTWSEGALSRWTKYPSSFGPWSSEKSKMQPKPREQSTSIRRHWMPLLENGPISVPSTSPFHERVLFSLLTSSVVFPLQL